MDKSAFTDWLENLDTEQIISIAETWGVQIAHDVTNNRTAHLETFSQYLQREYASCMADDADWHYDNWRENNL